MIVCPNCNHPNPDGAVQCEACYTSLPSTTNCPSCGATVQTDAAFCGQCGFNLRAVNQNIVATATPNVPTNVASLVAPNPVVQAQPIVVTAPATANTLEVEAVSPTLVAVNNEVQVQAPTPVPVVEETELAPTPMPVAEETELAPTPMPVAEEPELAPTPVPVAEEPELAPTPVPVARTQLQQSKAFLTHIQGEQQIELPQNLSVIHIGKPNDRIPPDIDISGFSNSEIVSRIHADIRVEGDFHYIEDVGSSNGTYINNLPLLPGNRHKMRPGDRISLGKGDLVTFLFQLS